MSVSATPQRNSRRGSLPVFGSWFGSDVALLAAGPASGTGGVFETSAPPRGMVVVWALAIAGTPSTAATIKAAIRREIGTLGTLVGDAAGGLLPAGPLPSRRC